MDGEATDDMEMKERGEQEAAEQEGDEETNVDDERRDESILIIDGSNPIFTRPDDRSGGSIPDVKQDAAVMKRYMIHDKKQFLENGLGITVNKGDGPSSTTLYDELRTTTSGKTNRINGAKYKGKKILFLRKGRMVYSTSDANKQHVEEFEELLKRADREHKRTATYISERRTGVDITQGTADNINSNVNDKIGAKMDDAVEDIKTNTELTKNELRELRGLLNPKGKSADEKLKFVKVESDEWKKKAREEGDTPKGKLYEAISRVADLKADSLRLEMNQKPKSEEVISMLEEEAESNDLTRYERFKKWARENLTNLSSIAISVAGIITTAVLAGRKVLNNGADALKKFAKAVAKAMAKLSEKLGPLISALGTLISNLILLGAKGLSFLAENLFILVLAIVYLIYNEYKDRRGRLRGQ